MQDTKSYMVEGLRIYSLFVTGWNSQFWLPFIPLIVSTNVLQKPLVLPSKLINKFPTLVSCVSMRKSS
jgi:hypothetical protein